MKSLARVTGLALAILSGCTTTGDPQQGGLFGWSEKKAKERQRERQAKVSGAESELATETQRSEELQGQASRTDKNLAAANAQRAQADENLRRLQAELVAKTERLENASPTPATASRARAMRLKVNTIAAQTALPPNQRTARLQDVGAEIDAALNRLNQ